MYPKNLLLIESLDELFSAKENNGKGTSVHPLHGPRSIELLGPVCHFSFYSICELRDNNI